MIGLFGRMTTTDDTEELAHLKNSVDAARNSTDLQVRLRSSHLSQVEDDLYQARRKARKERVALRETKEDLEQTKNRLAEVEAENQRLKDQQEALRETAINIAIDRKAIFNTIEYLNKKWGKNAPKSPEAQEYEKRGAIVLFDEAEEVRTKEYQKMEVDRDFVQEVAQRIDSSANHKLSQKRRRTSPKS